MPRRRSSAVDARRLGVVGFDGLGRSRQRRPVVAPEAHGVGGEHDEQREHRDAGDDRDDATDAAAPALVAPVPASRGHVGLGCRIGHGVVAVRAGNGETTMLTVGRGRPGFSSLTRMRHSTAIYAVR